MSEDVKFELQAAHQHFAKNTNARTWSLLSQDIRTKDEDFEMEFVASASLYHWAEIGSPLQLQRGEWLVAHVYTVLGLGDAALRHAQRCLELTVENPELMQDFDVAYGFEGMARALGLVGEMNEAALYHQKASQAGVAIADDEDRSIFMGDFQSGDWFGIT